MVPWLVLLVAACGPQQPSGQVLANVDGADVTAREIEQEARSAAGDPGDGAQGGVLERVVGRKILAREAEARGLEREARFHFELRRARDLLLAEALRRDIREDLAQPSEQDLARLVARQPWRFGGRFLLEIAPRANSPATDRVVIDSAGLDAAPDPPLLSARKGDTMAFDGRKWVVLDRRDAPLDHAEARKQALEQWQTAQVDARLRQIVLEYRQSGKIRYQRGLPRD